MDQQVCTVCVCVCTVCVCVRACVRAYTATQFWKPRTNMQNTHKHGYQTQAHTSHSKLNTMHRHAHHTQTFTQNTQHDLYLILLELFWLVEPLDEQLHLLTITHTAKDCWLQLLLNKIVTNNNIARPPPICLHASDPNNKRQEGNFLFSHYRLRLRSITERPPS